MSEIIIALGPWVLSATTIASVLLAGMKLRLGWAIGFYSQIAWLAFTLATGSLGFLPMIAVLSVVYAMNWQKWGVDNRP